LKITQVLDTVWEIENFFPDFDQVKQSYRSNDTPWTSQYPNRLLTPWDRPCAVNNLVNKYCGTISNLVGQTLQPQVSYASLDLGGSQIMMHRLHPDIRCFVQVCMADQEQAELATNFCTDADMNANYLQDYESFRIFKPDQVQAVSYQPNTAYVFLNHPRRFMGTAIAVPANSIRETVNLHFALAV
jgi:hypothetical protein